MLCWVVCFQRHELELLHRTTAIPQSGSRRSPIPTTLTCRQEVSAQHELPSRNEKEDDGHDDDEPLDVLDLRIMSIVRSSARKRTPSFTPPHIVRAVVPHEHSRQAYYATVTCETWPGAALARLCAPLPADQCSRGRCRPQCRTQSRRVQAEGYCWARRCPRLQGRPAREDAIGARRSQKERSISATAQFQRRTVKGACRGGSSLSFRWYGVRYRRVCSGGRPKHVGAA
jgi:hypothetical protein